MLNWYVQVMGTTHYIFVGPFKEKVSACKWQSISHNRYVQYKYRTLHDQAKRLNFPDYNKQIFRPTQDGSWRH